MKYSIIFFIFFLAISCNQKSKDYSVLDSKDLKPTDSIISEDVIIPEKIEISYPIEYIQVQPDSIKEDYKKDSIYINESLWYNDLQIITGIIDNNEEGIHLVVINSKDEVLYTSSGQLDSWRYKPTLYKSKDSERIIIISEIGDEESWGVYIQEYNNEKYQEIGFLDIVALNEYGESLNVTPYIVVKEISDEILEFSFDEKIKIYESESESEISGEKLSYRYHNKKLQKNIK